MFVYKVVVGKHKGCLICDTFAEVESLVSMAMEVPHADPECRKIFIEQVEMTEEERAAIPSINLEDYEEDYTGHFGPPWSDNLADEILPPQVRMYSFNRPAILFWSAFCNELMRTHRLTEQQAFAQMQSKGMRWMLDEHDERLEVLGRNLARTYKPIDLSDKTE